MSISSIGGTAGVTPSNVRAVAPEFMRKYEDLSPERKAEMAEDIRRSEAGLRSDREMAEQAKIQSKEVHDRIAPNVSTLTKEQALQQIESMSELIQSGQAEDTKLWTGYGDKTTNNYRQYVYWLQQHVKELEGAQPKSDVKA